MQRMIGLLCAVAMALVVGGAGLAGQTPPAPKPGAEHQKLGYFVGKWTSEGDMKPSPFGPGGKMSMNDTCEWFQGRFAVVCHSDGKGPTGPIKGLGIMSYSADQKVYTYYSVDNSGMVMTTVPRGTVQGDTWTYTDETTMGGQKIKSRYTIKTASPSSYTFKWEMLGADGKWTSLLEGTSTKVKQT